VRGWIGGLATAALLAAPTAAMAQADPTVSGRAAGGLERGGLLRITVTGTHPDGWRSLHELGADLELNGVALEQVRYDLDRGEVTVGSSSALLGTGNIAEGMFLRIPAIDVSQNTGGNRASVTLRATVLEDLPAGSELRFALEDDEGDEASVLRGLPEQEEDGSVGVSTLTLAIIAALIGGGLVGGRVAAHRRPDPRESVYGTVARRIREERDRS
jgi:hypothetical protein